MAVKDGWHKVWNYDLCVEDGKVVRAVKTDSNGGRLPAALYMNEYKYNPFQCKMISTGTLINVGWGIDFNNIKSGIYRGYYFVR